MFGRGKIANLMKPKKLHSLEYLKYLYTVLQKNPVVGEQNCETIVEAVRLIAEILIWGDQNDGTVMDFFLEKNILDDFMKYLKQNPGRLLCVQLLQTLNILFENICNQTAIYYLLSSSHTNEIITHRFDFSDEEMVAYYVSFLKTLSLRLNAQTINFFYFEQRHEFDLYVEAIKLFCHPENMVRIAVRTITLNVHRVKDEGALEFIHHQTSVPYFSYLVWSVGNTVLDIDALLRSDNGFQCYSKLGDLVAEHIDHLHYVNDLLSLDIEAINEVLCDQLLRRLLIPLHVYSLTKRYKRLSHKLGVSRPHVSNPVATHMLLHCYLIIKNPDLIRILTEAIFLGDPSLTDLVPRWNEQSPDRTTSENQDNQEPGSERSEDENAHSDADMSDEINPAMRIAESLLIATLTLRNARSSSAGRRLSAYIESVRSLNRHPAFLQPSESLEACLRHAKGVTPSLLASIWPASLEPLVLTGQRRKQSPTVDETPVITGCTETHNAPSAGSPSARSLNIGSTPPNDETPIEESVFNSSVANVNGLSPTVTKQTPLISTPHSFIRERLPSQSSSEPNQSEIADQSENSFSLQGRPFLRALYRALEIGPGTDYDTLFTLLLLQAIRTNEGVDEETLRLVHLADLNVDTYPNYDDVLVGKLLDIICDGCKAGSHVRLVTLHVTMQLLTELVCDVSVGCQLSDEHFAQVISAREEAMMVLRSYFQNDAIFLDVFEHELRHIGDIPVPLKRLAMDPSLLLPPPTASGIVNKSSPSTSREGQKTPVRIDRFRRMPQSQVEHTQHAIEVFLLVHIWLESLLRVRSGESNRSLHLEASKSLLNNANADNSQLFSPRLSVDLSLVPGLAGLGDVPDPKVTLVHKAGDKLDLSSEALIGCTVESKGSHEKRFLVNYSQQLVLVEPDSKQIGWGVITFIGSLQDLEATCDPADSRCLHVNINQPGHLSSVACYEPPNGSNQRLSSKPLLCARFLFEDHIRCMTARQMLLRGREMARETKLRKIATLLDFSPQFIRDTFLGPGSGYNSASTFSNFEISSRAVAHGRFGVSSLSSAYNTTDLSSGWSSRGLAPTTVRQHIPNRDPGAFLLERQNRLRSNRSYPDGDLSEGRLTLITLASRSSRSGSRQDKDDQNGVDPQSVSPSTANQKSGTNPVSFHVQPLLHQPVSPSLHSPRFTIMPPPDEESVPMNAPFSSPSIKPSSRSDNSVNTACISPRHSRLV